MHSNTKTLIRTKILETSNHPKIWRIEADKEGTSFRQASFRRFLLWRIQHAAKFALVVYIIALKQPASKWNKRL